MGRYPMRTMPVKSGGLKVGGVAVEGGATLENVTASSAEINKLTGTAAGLTASELSILDGVTATAAQINTVAGVTPGTVAASKAVVVDANKDAAAFRNVTLTGNLIGDLDVTEAHTSGDTLLASESGSVHTNEGAGSTVTLVLPAATVGQHFKFHVMAAQALRLDPNTTQTIALPSTGAQSAAGKYIEADAVGEFVEIRCVKAGQWEVGAYRGTWSVEG